MLYPCAVCAYSTAVYERPPIVFCTKPWSIDDPAFPLAQTGTFDSIVTVFFLDTAPVVVEYIETIAR